MIAQYKHKRFWKIGLFSIAVLIGVSSIVYTNFVVKKLANEELERVKLMVDATKLITELDVDNEALGFLISINKRNTTTPVIITDTSGNITHYRNLDSTLALDTNYLKKKVEEMRAANEPLKLNTDYPEYFYYGDSSIILMLRYYPYVQLFIIALFILVSYMAFSSSRKFEQNQVWVGMSKETAHQLGTPLSSLMAWVEYLRTGDGNISNEIIDEIEKDVDRLNQVTERFSKVGSQPELEVVNIYTLIEHSVAYLQKRISNKVLISITADSDKNCVAQITPSLFEWVIENLCKNAVDAMEGVGSITFHIETKGNEIIIDVTDTGKGIPILLQKTVFNPGYTTRKRGWGLGLSLAKRIVESYHGGQIFVHNSEVKKGTTFRIKLPLQVGIQTDDKIN